MHVLFLCESLWVFKSEHWWPVLLFWGNPVRLNWSHHSTRVHIQMPLVTLAQEMQDSSKNQIRSCILYWLPQNIPVNVVLFHSADFRSIEWSKAIAHLHCFMAMDLHSSWVNTHLGVLLDQGLNAFWLCWGRDLGFQSACHSWALKFAFEMLNIVSRNYFPPLFFPMSMFVYLNNLFGLLCHTVSVAYVRCHPSLKRFCLWTRTFAMKVKLKTFAKLFIPSPPFCCHLSLFVCILCQEKACDVS